MDVADEHAFVPFAHHDANDTDSKKQFLADILFYDRSDDGGG